MDNYLVPQDDRSVFEFLSDDHECEFDIDPDVPIEDNWHYYRRCYVCKETFWSLHCRCEGPRICSVCRQLGRIRPNYDLIG